MYSRVILVCVFVYVYVSENIQSITIVISFI